jgi:S1-C subfamily serine protease
MSSQKPGPAPGAVDNQTPRPTASRRTARALAVGATALTFTLAGTGSALAQTPASAPSPEQATPTERTAAEVRPAIVYVMEKFTGFVAAGPGTYFNNGKPYELSFTCTGFGVNPDGYVATAGHCVDIASPNGIKSEFIAAAAKELVAVAPSVTLQQAIGFGTVNWTVEGTAKGSPIDTQIAVVTGSVQGGGTPQALPARVVDSRPFDQGDVALLKVETSDLPSVELATDADVQVGTPVLSIGYPASADAVTDPSLEPSNKDGQVSSKKTVGSVPVYETSAALTPGMSGGPTVDLNDRVLGLNSFMPSGESQAFNFIAPSSGLSELLSRNGVRNELGTDDRAFRAALDSYYTGHYTDAIAGFDKLLQVAPQHAQAMQFRALAAKAHDKYGDVSSGLPLGLSPVAFWSVIGGGAALVVGLAVLLVVAVARRRSRRRTPNAGVGIPTPPQPMPFPGPFFGPGPTLPRQAERASAQVSAQTSVWRSAQPPAWTGAWPTDRTANLRTMNRSTPPAPAAVMAAQREACQRCGMRMAAEAGFCPTCGQARRWG